MPRWTQRTDEERFFEKVDFNGPWIDGMESQCWQWIGGKQGDGYGSFGVPNPNSDTWKMWLAHRFSYYLTYGFVPESGFELCHRCDNRACVRPDHLFVGTHTDNIQDMVRKDRSYDKTGEHNPKSKLTWDDVHAIRDFYNRGLATKAELGRSFNVSATNIKAIVERQIWIN